MAYEDNGLDQAVEASSAFFTRPDDKRFFEEGYTLPDRQVETLETSDAIDSYHAGVAHLNQMRENISADDAGLIREPAFLMGVMARTSFQKDVDNFRQVLASVRVPEGSE